MDSLFSDFDREPINLMLGLGNDRMNPFGNISINHTSWPIFLMVYN